MYRVDNHWVREHEKMNRPEALKLEQRLILLRNKIDDLSIVADTVSEMIPLSKEYEISEEALVEFHNYINSEVIATLSEEEITRDDYFRAIAT